MKSQEKKQAVQLSEETQKNIYEHVYLNIAKTFASGSNYGSSEIVGQIKKVTLYSHFCKEVIAHLKGSNPIVNFFHALSSMKLREVTSLKNSFIHNQPDKRIYLQIIDKYKNDVNASNAKTLLEYLQEVLQFRSSLQPLESNQDRFNAIILISEIMKLLLEFKVEPQMILPNLWLSDFIGSDVASMLRSMNTEELAMISSFYLASEDINQQGLGYLFSTDHSLIIDFLEKNTAFLTANLYTILTRAIQFENIRLLEFITSRIPEFENISQQNYSDIFQNILNAFTIGNRDVCKFFLESKLWDYLNIYEQVTLIRTLVIRADQTTLNELIDLMIEKGIFTIFTFMSINDKFLLPQGARNTAESTFSLAEEYKKEIANKLASYQENILAALFEHLKEYDQGISDDASVLMQISGIANTTKYFARSVIQKVVKTNYMSFKKYLPAYRETVLELKEASNPNAKYVELFVKYFTEAEQEARKANENVKEIQDSWAVEIKLPVTKNPPKKSKKKKAPFKIAENKKLASSEEKATVVDSDQKPADDSELNIASTLVRPSSSSEQHRCINAEEDHPKPKVERRSYLETLKASLIEEEQKPLPIIAPIIGNSDAKPEEPEEIIISSNGDDRPEDDAHGSLVVQKPEAANLVTTDVVEEGTSLSKEASTPILEQKEVVIISSEFEDQINTEITFGSFGTTGKAIAAPLVFTQISELQISDDVALRFGNISPISSHEDEESDVEAKVIIDQTSGENTEKTIESESSIITTKSTYIPIPKVAAPGNVYLGYTPTKTQWLYTDTGKLIYHILITNYDQSLTSLYINPSNPAGTLTQEEYRTLKPSEMSTGKSLVNIFYDMYYNPFYAVYVYNDVQLVLSYTIMPYRVTDGYSIRVEWQIGSITSYAGSLQLTDSFMSVQQTEVQESKVEEEETSSSGVVDKTKTHSEQGGSTNTNLSDTPQSTNASAILSSFKEHDPRVKIEFTINMEINKDKEDSIESEEAKQYREHKEEIERNNEDQTVKFVLDEPYSDMFNTLTSQLGAFDEKLFKPFLGEHDHPAFKFAGFASM